jgi:hypothetical protein
MQKLTSSILSYSNQAKTNFLHFKPFQSGQNRLSPFQAIPVGPKLTFSLPSPSVKPKPTSFIPSFFSRGKTYFLHSKPFQSGQNLLPPFQAIPVRPNPTFPIPSHSSRAKNDFLPSHSSLVNIVDKSSLLALSQLVTELFSSCYQVRRSRHLV